MINPLSDESEEFKDYLKLGYRSEYADLCVHVDQMGDISPDDMARIHIRKEKEPFREVTFGDGSKGRVWCTFTEKQIDLNYNSPKTYALMEDYIKFRQEERRVGKGCVSKCRFRLYAVQLTKKTVHDTKKR